jgi:hypothetical protein
MPLFLDLDRLQPKPPQQNLPRLPQGAHGIDARLRPQADDEGAARCHVAKHVVDLFPDQRAARVVKLHPLDPAREDRWSLDREPLQRRAAVEEVSPLRLALKT